MFFHIFTATKVAKATTSAMKRAVACAAAPMCCFCPVCGELAARLYELEEYYLCVVALAGSKLEDPGVAALTVSVLRSDFLK